MIPVVVIYATVLHFRLKTHLLLELMKVVLEYKFIRSGAVRRTMTKYLPRFKRFNNLRS